MAAVLSDSKDIFRTFLMEYKKTPTKLKVRELQFKIDRSNKLSVLLTFQKDLQLLKFFLVGSSLIAFWCMPLQQRLSR